MRLFFILIASGQSIFSDVQNGACGVLPQNKMNELSLTAYLLF